MWILILALIQNPCRSSVSGFRAERQVWSLQILTLYNFYTLSGLLLVEETL